MRLTTKGRFAVTAMIDLALYWSGKPVPLSEISERQKISLSYLEQLFGKLRKSHIVKSARGPGGGYSLARPVEEISVADIVRAVDETLDSTKCGGMGHCADEKDCMTHELWSTLNSKMDEYLASVSLNELVQKEIQKRVAL